MKNLIFLFIIIFNISSLHAQINVIKSNCQELCFNIPIKAKKFDVRTKFHSDNNFSNISEKKNYDDDYILGAYFIQNFKLSYIKYSRSSYIYYYFKPNTETCYLTKIGLYFEVENFKYCLEQYNELNNIFKKISYSSFSSDITREGEKTGEGIYLYSSINATNTKPTEANEFSTNYMDYSYRFLSVQSGYTLEIYIRHNNFF
jgi:hypothetical protein